MMRAGLALLMILFCSLPAAAEPDLAVAIAGMLAAEQECSGIALDHRLIDRVVAGETASDPAFERCALGGCRKGAVLRLQAMPAGEKATVCAAWQGVIGRAGYLRHD